MEHEADQDSKYGVKNSKQTVGCLEFFFPVE